jgi:hypothetical protein
MYTFRLLHLSVINGYYRSHSHMDKLTVIEAIIQTHGARTVFEATFEWKGSDYAPLEAMGLRQCWKMRTGFPVSPVLPILPITGCQQKREHRTTGVAVLLCIVFGDNVAMSAPANPHHWKDTKEKAYQMKSRLEPRTTDRCSGPNLLSDMRLFF